MKKKHFFGKPLMRWPKKVGHYKDAIKVEIKKKAIKMLIERGETLRIIK
jgi:hypothetical protein